MGHLALGRGEHGRRPQRLRGRARIRLRGAGDRHHPGRPGADQADGALRPRGHPVDPRLGDRLPDRGQRPPGRRLLPLHPEPGPEPARRRGAGDAGDGGHAELRHGAPSEGRQRPALCRGCRSTTRPADAEKHPTPSTRRARRRGRRASWASRAPSTPAAASTSRPPRPGTRRRARCGATRPTSRTSSKGTLTLLFESPSARKLDEPDSLTVSPRGGILLCEDGSGEEAPHDVNFMRGLSPSGHVFDFARNERPLVLEERAIEELAAVQQALLAEATGGPQGRHRRLERVRRRRVGPGRALAVREHPVPRGHVRDHRTVGAGLALDGA